MNETLTEGFPRLAHNTPDMSYEPCRLGNRSASYTCTKWPSVPVTLQLAGCILVAQHIEWYQQLFRNPLQAAVQAKREPTGQVQVQICPLADWFMPVSESI